MFQIDLMSRVPIYEQIIEQTQRLILTGLMKPLDKMPSIRNLSLELTVNPNTIQRAYTEMCSRGILCSVAGRGCFVAEEAIQAIQAGTGSKWKAFKELADELLLAGYEKEQLFRGIEEVCEDRRKKQDD